MIPWNEKIKKQNTAQLRSVRGLLLSRRSQQMRRRNKGKIHFFFLFFSLWFCRHLLLPLFIFFLLLLFFHYNYSSLISHHHLHHRFSIQRWNCIWMRISDVLFLLHLIFGWMSELVYGLFNNKLALASPLIEPSWSESGWVELYEWSLYPNFSPHK